MSLSLTQERGLNEIARHLYSFLPGNAHPYANQSISFAGVATSLGLNQFWSGGSKEPAISQLLSHSLEYRPEQFCPLIIELVRKGMVYRQNKGDPITREDIIRLNDLVAKVGFRIPELWDRQFLADLPSTQDAKQKAKAASPTTTTFENLKTQLLAMGSLHPQERGDRFEKFLGEVFDAFNLAPKGAFRLVGEQIDGSFQLQGETYLVEATWRNQPIGQEELLTFSGKVSGKAQWSRGLVISYSGFSKDGLEAYARGKPTNIVCMNGLDFHQVLAQNLELPTVLERKARRAAETNEAYVPVAELFPDVS